MSDRREVENAVYWYDFTIGADSIDRLRLIENLKEVAKAWVFQLELGRETKYRHYQGRLSLRLKKRLGQMIATCKWGKIHWSVTSTKGKVKSGFDYVMKKDTRIDGPWSDRDKEVYIPRQYRGKLQTLRPFQKKIWDSQYEFNDRSINLVVCERGNMGKSVITALCELHGRGIALPVVNDGLKIIQSMCNICVAGNLRDPNPVFIDIPRAFDQERMNGIYSAIEQIKSGKLYELRYNYKKWWIDSPVIWVFCNEAPNLNYLSKDRWKIWTIDESFELVKLRVEEEPEMVNFGRLSESL